MFSGAPSERPCCFSSMMRLRYGPVPTFLRTCVCPLPTFVTWTSPGTRWPPRTVPSAS